jgi:hypothetical protein
VLAVVTAVNNANVGVGGGPEAILEGFHAALFIPLAAAILGIVAMTARRPVRAAEPAQEFEEVLDEAA